MKRTLLSFRLFNKLLEVYQSIPILPELQNTYVQLHTTLPSFPFNLDMVVTYVPINWI